MGLLDTLFNFCFHCSHFYFWAVVRLFHIRLNVNASENDTFVEELKLVQNSLYTTAWWKISSCFITWLQNEFPQDVKSHISRIECTRKASKLNDHISTSLKNLHHIVLIRQWSFFSKEKNLRGEPKYFFLYSQFSLHI